MSTAPWDAQVAALRATSHTPVLRAVAYGGNLDASIELNVTSATVTFDEARAPRVVADVTAAVDTLEDLAALSRIDPRTGPRVAIEAGYVLEDGTEDVHDTVDLGIRFAVVSRPDNTARLALAGDEALVMDASAAVNAPVTAADVTDAIRTLIRQAISPAPTVVATIPATGAVAVNPVTDRWDTIRDLADRYDATVYDDGTRKWHIDPAPQLGAPVLELAGGPGGTLTAATDDLDREAWANYVCLVYRWRDAADVDKRVQATALVLTGDYRVTGPAGKRIFLEERSAPTTQDVANGAAAAVLRRMMTRSSGQTVTATSAWWLRPGHTVRVATVAGTTNRLVSRVTFSHPAGTMAVTTRLPDPIGSDGTAAAVGTTTPVPPPETPTTPTADPTPEADTKQTYVSTWKANAFASYRSNGTKRTDSATDHDVVFGNSGTGVNGNGSGVFLFTAANSTGDEVGKTITQALTGATVTRARLRGFATWWWSYAGGTARLGYYAGTAIPASYTGAKPYVSVKDWKRNTPRTADLTSTAFKAALVAGTSRGVTVGPGASSSTSWYGKLAADGANVPTLELTYIK